MGLISFLRDIWNTPPRNSIEHRAGFERKFSGAKRGRLYADWFTSNASANAEIWSSLTTLRNRSRDLCRNNDYARGVIQKLTDNVIYLGIGFQAQVKQIKNPDKNDDRINNLIESAWKAWGNEPKYCHTEGKLNWAQMQQLVFRSWLESGEVFIRQVNQSFSGSPIPFALEIIEADRLAEDHNQVYGNNQVVMGVELNKWKRPVAYWFYQEHPGELFQGRGGVVARDLLRIDATEIIHLHDIERPGQVRGVPLLASTLLRLKNVGDYEEYEQIAAKAAASIMGLITTDAADILGEPKQTDDSLPADEEMKAGVLRYLAPGEHLEAFDPKRPNPNVTGFIECQLRASGAGIGASYEHTANDYTKTNYSSSRLSLLNSRDRFKILQRNFAEKFNRNVYIAWLDLAVLSGVLNFPDYESRPTRYHNIRWQYRGWAWVDPHKEVQATLASLAGGLTTMTKVSAEQGEDFEETVKTIARERELMRQYGVDIFFEKKEVTDGS